MQRKEAASRSSIVNSGMAAATGEAVDKAQKEHMHWRQPFTLEELGKLGALHPDGSQRIKHVPEKPSVPIPKRPPVRRGRGIFEATHSIIEPSWW